MMVLGRGSSEGAEIRGMDSSSQFHCISVLLQLIAALSGFMLEDGQ
jgi:hypothetical protein